MKGEINPLCLWTVSYPAADQLCYVLMNISQASEHTH